MRGLAGKAGPDALGAPLSACVHFCAGRSRLQGSRGWESRTEASRREAWPLLLQLQNDPGCPASPSVEATSQRSGKGKKAGGGLSLSGIFSGSMFSSLHHTE